MSDYEPTYQSPHIPPPPPGPTTGEGLMAIGAGLQAIAKAIEEFARQFGYKTFR